MGHISKLLLGAALVMAAPSIATPTTYKIASLGVLPNGGISKGAAINEKGQVTGFGNVTGGTGGAARVILYEGGVLQNLGTLGLHSDYSYGEDINEAGQIAGYADSPAIGRSTAILHDGNSMIDLGTLGGWDSAAYGINDTGQVTGYAQTSNGTPHAFLYSNGEMQDLGTLGGGGSYGQGINNLGQVVGYDYIQGQGGGPAAFLYSNGVMTHLDTLGGSGGIAYAINDIGQIAGSSRIWFGNNSHAFLYDDGQMIDLGTLGGHTSRAYALNSLGQVTGTSVTAAAGLEYHAFLYTDGAMYDLNSLIDPQSGWELIEATSINDRGQITGYGLFEGRPRGFLLSPNQAAAPGGVPEPATWAMLLIGFGVIGSSLRRRRGMLAAAI